MVSLESGLTISSQKSMKHLKDNLLSQFSLVTLVILAGLAAIITTSLNSGLEQAINHLEIQREIGEGRLTDWSNHYSIANIIRETVDLKFKASLLIGSGFLLLYMSLYLIVRGSWMPITSQRQRLEAVNDHLQATVSDLELSNAKLVNEMEERQQLEAQL